MKRYKGFIFDLNGTMIDDMAYHESAWYDVLVTDLNAPLTREEMKKEMYGKHHEMFYRIFGKDKFTDSEIDAISEKKEIRYRKEFLPHLKLMMG